MLCLGQSAGRKTSLFKVATKRWQQNIKRSLAPSTKDGYRRAWKLWKSWIGLAQQDIPELDPLKPTKEVLCSFIDYQCIFRQIVTVKSYMKRINTVAKDLNKDKGGKGLVKKEWV